MDIATKKLELIKWLSSLEDREMVSRIDQIRNESTSDLYAKRMKENVIDRLKKSEENIQSDQILAQEKVESYFSKKISDGQG